METRGQIKKKKEFFCSGHRDHNYVCSFIIIWVEAVYVIGWFDMDTLVSPKNCKIVVDI